MPDPSRVFYFKKESVSADSPSRRKECERSTESPIIILSTLVFPQSSAIDNRYADEQKDGADNGLYECKVGPTLKILQSARYI